MIERKVKTVRALERGLQVLAEIDRRQGANLHELHKALGLPKATLLRMVVTLSKHGHVWQRVADGAYLPSMVRLPHQSGLVLSRVAEVASPFLVELSKKVAWPSVICVPRLDHMEIVETNSPLLRLDSVTLGPVGIRLSYVHTATGRAYLSACEIGERNAIIERVRPSEDDPDGIAKLESIIAETRARGYALREPFHPWPDASWHQRSKDERRSIAVPVMVQGRPVASLNITWLVRRSDTQTIVERHLGTLLGTADAIGAQLAAEFDCSQTNFAD